MAWRDRLRPASFRGIPFYIESHEYATGRNTVNHEVPDQDIGFTEDMGGTLDAYRLTGFVIGDNYFALRDALIAACKESGPGTLIHPYLGAKEVQVGRIKVTESWREGRVARFDMPFTDAGDPLLLFTVFDKIAGALDFATVAIAQTSNVFVEVFSIANLPGFVSESVVQAGIDFANTVNSSIDNVQTVPEQLASLKKRLSDFEDSIESLVQDNEEFAGEVQGIIGDMQGVVAPQEQSETIDITSGRDDSLDVFNDLIAFDSGAGDINQTTTTREAQVEALTNFQNLVKRTAIANQSQQAIAKEYKSSNDALGVRNSVNGVIDDILLNTGDNDDVFQAFEDLKQAVTNVLPNTDSQLSTIETYTPITTWPSIMVAYDLYQSIDNELDIIQRNGIRNPGFIDDELEVLSVG